MFHYFWLVRCSLIQWGNKEGKKEPQFIAFMWFFFQFWTIFVISSTLCCCILYVFYWLGGGKVLNMESLPTLLYYKVIYICNKWFFFSNYFSFSQRIQDFSIFLKNYSSYELPTELPLFLEEILPCSDIPLLPMFGLSLFQSNCILIKYSINWFLIET